jgi:hypothetical protein
MSSSAEKMAKFFEDDTRLRIEEGLYTPYEKKMHELDGEKLQYWSERAKTEKVAELRSSAITNKTLNQLGVACVSAIVGLFHDVATKLRDSSDEDEDESETWGQILTKEDRLIYIGVVVLVFAIFIFLVELTTPQ